MLDITPKLEIVLIWVFGSSTASRCDDKFCRCLWWKRRAPPPAVRIEFDKSNPLRLVFFSSCPSEIERIVRSRTFVFPLFYIVKLSSFARNFFPAKNFSYKFVCFVYVVLLRSIFIWLSHWDLFGLCARCLQKEILNCFLLDLLAILLISTVHMSMYPTRSIFSSIKLIILQLISEWKMKIKHAEGPSKIRHFHEHI